MQNLEPMNKALHIIEILQETYGRQLFERRDDPMHELILAMISPRTLEAQKLKAFANMWDIYGSWQDIMEADTDKLAEAIGAVQYARQKARSVQEALKIIKQERGEFNIDFLRSLTPEEAMKWLDDLPGVGPKTASMVLLFCFEMPYIPVDTHVERISKRVGVIGEKVSADDALGLLMEILPKDINTIYSYYALTRKLGQNVCFFSKPKHSKCPLTGICDYYSRTAKP